MTGKGVHLDTQTRLFIPEGSEISMRKKSEERERGKCKETASSG